ncbi:ParB N-terminal domain-containing protein [Jiangella alba]|uniref:Chromosome partitioning protein, ParB family n=1 Tax=Jiangella alba TaxID=561176 RepID=A0A1H5MYQ4_9ACTN|nr:ParB N-terminal domain-containing protein [Jiangella alba]SEE94454.1 chromosome partitioning protein, ParB family [Jiangella alba]
MADGYVLRHAVDEIQVGRAYRTDLGDVDGLVESIRTVGLLHPIVVSKAGWLISGLRRLEAVRRLGWREVDVWVAAKVSDRLQRALAVRDENSLRKDLNPIEAAALYNELKELYAEEAGRRQASTRFGAERAGTDGSVDSTEPLDARVQAARAITGRDSHGMLEQVLELQRLVADDATPAWLRAQVQDGLAGIGVDGKVNGRYLAITTARARHELEQAAVDETQPAAARDVAKAELERLAVLRSPQAVAQAAKRATQRVHQVADGVSRRVSAEAAAVQRLAASLKKHYGWWDLVDPDTVAEHLTAEQWDLLTSTWAATERFMRETVAARERRTTDAGG